MTTNGPSDIRILLDDAISEYISDTGDAPHYREHLLDLLESTLQADPQDTDLPTIKDIVGISAYFGNRKALADQIGNIISERCRIINGTYVEVVGSIIESVDQQDTVTISRQAAQAILMPSEHRDQYADALEELHQALTQEEPA